MVTGAPNAELETAASGAELETAASGAELEIAASGTGAPETAAPGTGERAGDSCFSGAAMGLLFAIESAPDPAKKAL
jgi:hypothetical protein